jgi:hypothetical protein
MRAAALSFRCIELQPVRAPVENQVAADPDVGRVVELHRAARAARNQGRAPASAGKIRSITSAFRLRSCWREGNPGQTLSPCLFNGLQATQFRRTVDRRIGGDVGRSGPPAGAPGYRHARKRTRVLLSLEAIVRLHLAQEDEISGAVTQPH